MSLPESIQSDRAIFFDDEPIESVLYSEQRTGPSNASAFAEARAEAEAIEADLAAGKTREAIGRIVQLLESGQAVPLSACRAFVLAMTDLIPQCPQPILPEGTDECGAALRGLISRAELNRSEGISSPAGALLYRWHEERYGSDPISSPARGLLYRWHEGRGEYAQARSVIQPMLKRAEREDNFRQAAILVANYGYEYLLEGRPADAEPYFERALERFTGLKIGFEIANARANLLTCRFALLEPCNWNSLVRDLADTHRTLHRSRDWRGRKTLRLFAELAVVRGRPAAAKRWAQRAVAASASVPTRLRENDEQFLRGLEEACGTANGGSSVPQVEAGHSGRSG